MSETLPLEAPASPRARGKVVDYARTDLLTCPTDTPLTKAAALMHERCCGSIVVVEGEQPVGIWTEHDALRLDFDDPSAFDAPIRTAMSTPLETIQAMADVGEAATRLQREQMRHLVVVDENGAVLGMVSQTDLTLHYGPDHFLRLRAVGESVAHGPLTLPAEVGIREVAARLREAYCDAAIIEGGERGFGILTERDLVACIARHGGSARAGDLASFPLLSVHVEAPLLDARRQLVLHGCRHLGVVDDEDKLVGLLGMSDIMEVLQRDYTEDLERALHERDAQLLDLRQDLYLARQVLDSSANAVVVLAADGTVESVNPAFTRITGYPAETMIGTPITALFEERESLDFLDDLCSVESGTGHWRGRRWCRHRDGGRRALAITAHRIEPATGGSGRCALSFHDATDEVGAEEEIQRSNTDLEQFAYAVSHDMRQPLRMINSYLQLLERKVGETLDEGARGYLRNAVEGARRMDAMITALLEYSRVGRKTQEKRHQPTRAALDEALEFLEPTLRETDALVEIRGEWPEWRISHDELVRLFQNLLSNALKYMPEGVQPVVTVDSRVANDGWHVAVTDNGIGIEPSQRERLFKVFARLHTETEYQGTGVGLALCRRIVEHHNGTIDVQSEGEGRGSCFCFHLPVET
ncbi:MAG: CBS domain-containing protein [Pseudomonadota bacterium]